MTWVSLTEPMPTLDGALGNFVDDRLFSEIDLCKGYRQIPLFDRASACTAFGLIEFTRLPFGLKTACATYIRLMCKIIYGLSSIDCYFDNLLIRIQYWSNHSLALERLFGKLRECFFGYDKIKYLGFSLGNYCLTIKLKRFLIYLNLEETATVLFRLSFILPQIHP